MRALAQQIIKSARVLIDALKERHLFYLTVGAFTAAVLGLLATPRTLTVALTTDVSISIPNANLYVGCALAVMGAALVAARAGVWQLQARERVDMENTLRKTYFEFIGGGVLLAGVFLSWTQFQYQVGTTERTLRATQEAQVTERFSRAVDQLGSDRPEQRIGATYALERIAYDSPRDLENVLALLASALRQRARWPAAGEPVREVVSERQAIVTVLGRLNGRVEPARDWRYRSWLDLRATDLRYLTFKGGNYQSFDFSEAAFRGAYLAYSDVSRARFVRSDLREVYMFQVKAQGADFTSTDLSCTVLVKAQLQDARFDKADLHGANLSLAVLSGAQFFSASLRSAVLADASGRNVLFSNSDLRGVDLNLDRWLPGHRVLFSGSNLMGARASSPIGEWAVEMGGAVTNVRDEEWEARFRGPKTGPSGDCSVDLQGERSGRPPA